MNPMINLMLNQLKNKNPNAYNMINRLMKENANPETVINELINSGQLDQKGFNNLKQQAENLIGAQNQNSKPKGFRF